jgi:murein DD-endopeptidase MepM/ murein hydrolase activator NlpD
MATCYGHQSAFAVSTGAHVSQGQVIGYVGNTGHSFGAHLHFEVRINGTPVDPLGYL